MICASHLGMQTDFGHPSEYEIVDENFGIQEKADPKVYGRGHQISVNKIGLGIVLIYAKIYLMYFVKE